MKRMYLTGLIFAIAVVFTGSNAYSYPANIGDTIRLQDGTGSTNGGIFRVYINNVYKFDTFCVETDEFINLGANYVVADISDKAVLGGANTNANDPLDFRTAWLFYNWSIGNLESLAGKSANYFRTTAGADDLQWAIWYIEQEYVGNNYLVDLANGKWNSIGPVRVVNIMDGSVYKQDVLITPEPGILILLGIAMSAIGMASWRLRKL